MKATVIESSQKQRIFLKETQTAEFVTNTGIEKQLINLYPAYTFQEVLGFGGAFTESTAVTLQSLSAPNYDKVVKAYFGQDGIGYTFCRTHINSCDFSMGNYAYVEDEQDKELSSFSIERDRQALIPLIRAAMEASERSLRLMASPWSPPPFMKTNDQMNGGGKLKEEYQALWAQYIARYIEQYRQEGIPIFCVSVQNEPKAKQPWDSCVYSAEEEKCFVRDHLGPVLESMGVKLLIWDHNKERVLERALHILDEKTAPYVYGVAFHWYSGDHFEAVDMTHRLFPDKKMIFSEGCCEQFIHADEVACAERYAHDMIGDFNSGCSAFIDWNLALDECGGPNHVGNFCAAPILCDTKHDRVHKMLSYYYIGQFSKFVTPGSRRMAYSKYTDKLDVASFFRPDGCRVVTILNRSEETLPFVLREGDEICPLNANPKTMMTVIVEPDEEKGA